MKRFVASDRNQHFSACPVFRTTPFSDLWSLLVETYEEEHFPIAKPDPVEAIRFRLEQSDSRPADLLPYLGTKGRVSEVLSGKRPLSLTMIRGLHHGLRIPAEVLIGEPKRPAKPSRARLHATAAK